MGENKILFEKRHDTDMTEGGIFKNLLLFTLPLLAGNLFQQLYNLVDTWVIGQTGVNAAFAAVGNVGPIINCMIGFFTGFSAGAGVVISQFYGAGDEKNVRKAVHTSFTATLILGVVISIVGIFVSPWILKMMLHTDGTENEVFPHALTYLTIYFSGTMGLLIYNIGAGILRAVGDSKRPFLFLVVSTVTNVILDILFVRFFGMGVVGVALATIIAQFVSAICAVTVLMRTSSCVKLRLKELSISLPILKRIALIGLPTGIQHGITAFSNVFVQGYISGANGNQTINMSAWTTYSKVDQLMQLPVQSVALAVMTFVGQNLGKGDEKRARKGTLTSVLMGFFSTAVILIPIVLFAPKVASVFNQDLSVIDGASMLLRTQSWFYLVCCIDQILAGAMRGAGNGLAPMLIMLSTFVGFRQSYLFVVSRFFSNDLLPIAFGYPAGWMACLTVMLIYYIFFFKYEKNRILG